MTRSWTLWAAPLVACAVSIASCTPKPAEAPPVLGSVTGLEFVDQDGQSFGPEQMTGAPWVVDFIFTNCGSLCPKLTAHMRAVRSGEIAEKHITRFLSISVDPENDDPKTLKAYAEKHGADVPDWRFVTGDFAEVERAIEKGFRVSMGERITGAHGKLMDITHAGHFVLVDVDRQIRGYYSSDNDGLAKLRRDLKTVQPAPISAK